MTADYGASRMDVAERIRTHGDELTAAERRVAAAILEAPQAVGFGTVADLARAAEVGAASVVRLAAKLGFDGYSALQESIQRDLTQQLRPAAERIREDLADDRAQHLAAELGNVRATLDGVDDEAIEAIVARLADLDRPVAVLSGEASTGVALQFVHHLAQLRDGVTMLGGSDVAVRRDIAVLPVNATVIVIDLRRYERWLLEAHAAIHERGIWSVGLTDSLLSPIATKSAATIVVSAGAVGPFDSHVGTLALLDLLANGVAAELRDTAADRLAAIEAGWAASRALTVDD